MKQKRIRIIMILMLFILLIIISACSSPSSYKDCKHDCAVLYGENFCRDKGGDIFFLNECIDGTRYSYREYCYEECKSK